MDSTAVTSFNFHINFHIHVWSNFVRDNVNAHRFTVPIILSTAYNNVQQDEVMPTKSL